MSETCSMLVKIGTVRLRPGFSKITNVVFKDYNDESSSLKLYQSAHQNTPYKKVAQGMDPVEDFLKQYSPNGSDLLLVYQPKETSNESFTLEISGDELNSDESRIVIKKGWNHFWIPFSKDSGTSSHKLTIRDLFVEFEDKTIHFSKALKRHFTGFYMFKQGMNGDHIASRKNVNDIELSPFKTYCLKSDIDCAIVFKSDLTNSRKTVKIKLQKEQNGVTHPISNAKITIAGQHKFSDLNGLSEFNNLSPSSKVKPYEAIIELPFIITPDPEDNKIVHPVKVPHSGIIDIKLKFPDNDEAPAIVW